MSPSLVHRSGINDHGPASWEGMSEPVLPFRSSSSPSQQPYRWSSVSVDGRSMSIDPIYVRACYYYYTPIFLSYPRETEHLYGFHLARDAWWRVYAIITIIITFIIIFHVRRSRTAPSRLASISLLHLVACVFSPSMENSVPVSRVACRVCSLLRLRTHLHLPRSSLFIFTHTHINIYKYMYIFGLSSMTPYPRTAIHIHIHMHRFLRGWMPVDNCAKGHRYPRLPHTPHDLSFDGTGSCNASKQASKQASRCVFSSCILYFSVCSLIRSENDHQTS
jgi:hypothetical protein